MRIQEWGAAHVPLGFFCDFFFRKIVLDLRKIDNYGGFFGEKIGLSHRSEIKHEIFSFFLLFVNDSMSQVGLGRCMAAPIFPGARV